jgi:hypothetical protein
MITDSILLSAYISNPCCGVSVDCMSYVLAKGNGGLAIYEPGNANIGWVAWLISGQQE